LHPVAAWLEWDSVTEMAPSAAPGGVVGVCLGLGGRAGSRLAGGRALSCRCPRLWSAPGAGVPVPGVLLAKRAPGVEERSSGAEKRSPVF